MIHHLKSLSLHVSLLEAFPFVVPFPAFTINIYLFNKYLFTINIGLRDLSLVKDLYLFIFMRRVPHSV